LSNSSAGRFTSSAGRAGLPAAYLDTCMHLGGPLVCENGRFQCQWHGAMFEPESGRRLSGPAPEGIRLLRLPTKVIDGVLTYVYRH
jgi:nitrite reductase/ring-hydroxylating ferredoxin subunit